MAGDPTDASPSRRENSPAQPLLVLAPREVVEHIGCHHRMIDPAVLGDEAEVHVLLRWHRQERATAPPARRRGAPPLADRGPPQAWMTDDGESDGDQRGTPTSGATTAAPSAGR